MQKISLLVASIFFAVALLGGIAQAQPYFKVYGGSVSVGGVFGLGSGSDYCQGFTQIVGGFGDTSGLVQGYINGSPGSYVGTSTQYALRAFGQQVDDFYSASELGLGQDADYLTFANTSGSYGGDFDVRRCIANYWRDSVNAETFPANSTKLSQLFTIPYDPSESYSKKSEKSSTTSPLKIQPESSVNTLNSLRAVVYSNHGVYIKGDIINNSLSRWELAEQIGTIYIIAKGNIYIDASVNTIDAVLVAIPDDSSGPISGGKVITCYENDESVLPETFQYPTDPTKCNNPLTINGAVIARSLHLGRTNGDLAADPNDIAETINLTPEYFLSPPAQGTSVGELYSSDSVQSRPPVL